MLALNAESAGSAATRLLKSSTKPALKSAFANSGCSEPSANFCARARIENGETVFLSAHMNTSRKFHSSIFVRSMPRKAAAISRARSRRKLARFALLWDVMFRTSFASSAISLRIPSVRAS